MEDNYPLQSRFNKSRFGKELNKITAVLKSLKPYLMEYHVKVLD